ncbi:hypothetical protein RHMOL_Rhmol05G0249600 [Rhododendron molle]|uniref:Uncharacterized protein n=1 Tax=Rhododendron molle TaxID=49168 RepID=A0ACC0NT01_RHOML|nr:hypothetical protein RHMOL_Rhmol05G0249600 [Rhododendron molle]
MNKTCEGYSTRPNCQNAMLDGYRQYNCQNVSIVFNIPPQNIERSNAYFVDANIRVKGVSAEAMRFTYKRRLNAP